MQTVRRLQYWHGICTGELRIKNEYENNKTGNKDIIEIQAIFFNQSVGIGFKPDMWNDITPVYLSGTYC